MLNRINSRIVLQSFRNSTITALVLAGLGALACRPEGYVAPPADPSEPPDRIPIPETAGLSKDALLSVALLGADVAPPSVRTPPADAEVSQSGLVTVVLEPGSGKDRPQPGDTVVLHFTGWDENGERFDSSVIRGAPDRQRLQTLVPGYREGVSQMVEGEKRRLWVPERLAFGSVPSPGRPAGDVVLDVELLKIVPAPAPPKVPEDLAAPPSDAITTASGLKYKVLRKGSGSSKPNRDNQVLVHYSGWTLDGALFDSSVSRGEPITFGVTDVIKGWTEMLLLMVEGERVRVWIPSALAYGDNPGGGRPGGKLVFEVELIEIH